MVSEWSEMTVGQFCPFIYGKALPERSRIPGVIPVISSAGISGTHAEPLINRGGVVIGRKGTVGSVTLSKSPFWAIDTAFYITDEPSRDLIFTYYLLKTKTLGLERMNSDSAVPGLNRDNAHARRISVPPLPEQRAIAHILGTLDDKIEINRKQNETLEAMARALFKAWFVDFEPVRAKQDGRWLRGQPLPGLPAHLYDLFPDRLVESELGEIPEGWRVGALSNLAAYLNGYAFKTKDWQDAGHPVVKIGNVKPGLIDVSGTSFVSAAVVIGLERFKLNRGDLLVGMTGYVGETGLVPSIDPPAYLNQRVGKISTKHGVGDLGFVYCAVRTPAYKSYAESKSQGSAQANVSGTELMAYPCVMPSINVLDAFNAIVCSMIEGILERHDESRSLAQLRDTLLPKLISGELRVPDAQRILDRTFAC